MADMIRGFLGMGMFLFFLGFIVIAVVLLLSGAKNVESKFAVGGSIGPIPFGFGNSQGLIIAVTAIGLFVFLTIFILGRMMSN